MDRTELREKLIEWRAEKYYRANSIMIPVEFEDEFEERKLKELDQILALYPDVEELRASLTELEKKLDDREADLINAKREERERIIAWGVEPCPHWAMYPDVKVIKRDCSQCWQALRGEK